MSPCPSRAVEKSDRTIRAVFHWCLPLSRNQGFTGSCLCYADYSVTHDQSAVKVHGVFPSRCGHPASSPEPQIRRAVRQDSRSIIPPFVQVGTYPTRNFARFLLLCFQRRRTLSFAACVHYRSYLPNFFNAFLFQVFSLIDQVKDLSEPREVDSLLRFKRMLFEEGNNPFGEVIQPPDSVRHSISVILSHYAASEKLLQCVQQLNVTFMLNDGEFGEYLKLAGHLWVWIDADVETTFAVNKS